MGPVWDRFRTGLGPFFGTDYGVFFAQCVPQLAPKMEEDRFRTGLGPASDGVWLGTAPRVLGELENGTFCIFYPESCRKL